MRIIPIWAVCGVLVLFSTVGIAQSPYLTLINAIQAEEVNFPFPQKDTIVNVGTIDVGGGYPIITYSIPISNINHQHVPGFPESTRDLGWPGPNRPIKVGEKYIDDTTLNLTGGNNLHMTLRFKVINWKAATPTVTLTLGTQSKTVPQGAPYLDFADFLETEPGVACWFPDQKPTPPNTSPYITQHLYGHFLHISWNVAGIGIITMPVLPVKIVYAPLVDAKMSNTASISDTKVIGYSSSVGVNSVNSTTLPIPTTLSTIDDALKDIGDLGKALSLDPETEGVAKYVSTISTLLTDALGQNTITQTVSNSVTDQATFSTDSSETDQIIAKAAVGGPGVGDVIAFYTNAKLVWMCHNGKMELSLLGFDQTLKTPSVSQLSESLSGLKRKPAGTLDPTWKIDAKAIQSLISLDPFTGSQGQYTQLDPSRFTIAHKGDGTEARYQNGGADIPVSISHQVQSGDSHASATVNSTLEEDKPGFLAFLGIGETENKTIQYSYSKSASSGYTIGETLTAQFVLHGDGKTDHYECEVFFDNVFGTFAFRDNSRDLDKSTTVSGLLYNAANKTLSNTSVTLTVGENKFSAMTDRNGKFEIRLPHNLQEQEIMLIAKKAQFKIKFEGKAIANVKLILQE
jgi:hypothetical protein